MRAGASGASQQINSRRPLGVVRVLPLRHFLQEMDIEAIYPDVDPSVRAMVAVIFSVSRACHPGLESRLSGQAAWKREGPSYTLARFFTTGGASIPPLPQPAGGEGPQAATHLGLETTESHKTSGSRFGSIRIPKIEQISFDVLTVRGRDDGRPLFDERALARLEEGETSYEVAAALKVQCRA